MFSLKEEIEEAQKRLAEYPEWMFSQETVPREDEPRPIIYFG